MREPAREPSASGADGAEPAALPGSRALLERLLAALETPGVGPAAAPHEQLAADAVWLAVSALGERARPGLERVLDGSFWRRLLRPGESTGAPGGSTDRARAAVALLLLEAAADPDIGAAERVAAALACLALGCADPDAGAAVQRGLGDLRLLDLVRQIPVAARVRALAMEFRFRNLERRLPAAFVARVQDLLERLDAEALLAVRLLDRTGARRGDVGLQALVRSASPRLTSMARALARADGPMADPAALAAACAAEAPDLWGRWTGPAATEQAVATYAELKAALAGSPFRLLPGGRSGYGVAPASNGAGRARAKRPRAKRRSRGGR